jgi:hypothetical protein
MSGDEGFEPLSRPPRRAVGVAVIQALTGLFTLVFSGVLGVHFFWICGALILGGVSMYQGRAAGRRLSQGALLAYAVYLVARLGDPRFPTWLRSPALYLLAVVMVALAGALSSGPVSAYFGRRRR